MLATLSPLPLVSAGASAAPSASSPPHVMVIVMENHEYGTIVGSPTAPYVNGLVGRYGLATASFAWTHPSLPNYLDLVSGSTQGITTDCTSCTADAPELVDQLQAAGVGWKAYMESMPSPCYSGNGAYPYDKNHDPFVYAPHVLADPAECDRVVPYSQLANDLADGAAPPFLWVTPNVLDDMHTGTVLAGDTWLSQQLPIVMSSSWYRQGGIIIITFDEGTSTTGCCTGAAGGHIATLVISSIVAPGSQLSTPVDHAGVLRTIEDLYGLPLLGAAASPASGSLLGLLTVLPAATSGTSGTGTPTVEAGTGTGSTPGAAGDGGVFAFGTAPFLGSMGGRPLNAPVVGMAATPTGHGYWEVAADGGVFAFGTAPFLGSMGGRPLTAPVVGMAATPTGHGYWEVAADGGVFAFGTAPFLGSMGGRPLTAPVVGMAATPTGHGYWEVAADGGVFAFGTAAFRGSMGGSPLNAPVVGMAATPTGGGYWEVASDGGVFAFGTAAFLGSMGGTPLDAPVVGMAATPTGHGYWEVAADGGVFSFGTAAFRGSMGGSPLNAPVRGMVGTTGGTGYWLVS